MHATPVSVYLKRRQPQHLPLSGSPMTDLLLFLTVLPNCQHAWDQAVRSGILCYRDRGRQPRPSVSTLLSKIEDYCCPGIRSPYSSYLYGQSTES